MYWSNASRWLRLVGGLGVLTWDVRIMGRYYLPLFK